MKVLSPNTAERDYPSAWSEVQAQVAEIKQVSNADMIALGAAVIDDKGVPTLEVVFLTDLVPVDVDVPATGLRIRVPLNTPSMLRKLH